MEIVEYVADASILWLFAGSENLGATLACVVNGLNFSKLRVGKCRWISLANSRLHHDLGSIPD
jgi:hypothetical protein